MQTLPSTCRKHSGQQKSASSAHPKPLPPRTMRAACPLLQCRSLHQCYDAAPSTPLLQYFKPKHPCHPVTSTPSSPPLTSASLASAFACTSSTCRSWQNSSCATCEGQARQRNRRRSPKQNVNGYGRGSHLHVTMRPMLKCPAAPAVICPHDNHARAWLEGCTESCTGAQAVRVSCTGPCATAGEVSVPPLAVTPPPTCFMMPAAKGQKPVRDDS